MGNKIKSNLNKNVFGGYSYEHNHKLITLLNSLVDDDLSPLGKLEKFLERNKKGKE